MKKLACLIVLAGLVSAVQAAEVWFDDAGDLSSWGVSEYVAGEYITVESTWADVDANGQEFWLSSWNDAATSSGSWTDIWSGSGVFVEAEKQYTLTIKLGSWDTGLEFDEVGTQPAGAGDQVWFGMEAWSTNATVSLAEDYLWPDNSTGDSQGYANYSISFDTFSGNNAASLGAEIGVSISSIGWWNNFSVSEMSIDAVPEPATFGLVGLFGVGLLFARRHLRI
jgi:hypothetical protein